MKRNRKLVSPTAILDIASDSGSISSGYDIVYYTDWFLPSKDELAAMYDELKAHAVGGFANDSYWSSSENDADQAEAQNFTAGATSQPAKSTTEYIRACRSFTAAAAAYILRDVGPAGGLIFYVDGGTTYYEAAPSDQSIGKAWSNVTDVEIGVTAQGTAIGTGQANTTAIIIEVGHTTSAAELCDDLDTSCTIHTDSAAKLCDETTVLEEIEITVNNITIFKDGEVLAMIFNGSTSYIINYIIDQLSNVTASSFAAWIKTKDATITQEIISFGDTDADTRIQFDIDGAGLLRALVGVTGTVQWALDTDDTVIINNEWTHVALVQNGTEPVLYVNGIAVAQTFSVSTDKTFWFNDMPGLDNGRIGCGNWNSGGNANFFHGLINDVRIDIGIWTAREVSQIFSKSHVLYNV